MENIKKNWQAIQFDDSANGFTGWIEFEADCEADAFAHAENIFGTPNFSLEQID